MACLILKLALKGYELFRDLVKLIAQETSLSMKFTYLRQRIKEGETPTFINVATYIRIHEHSEILDAFIQSIFAINIRYWQRYVNINENEKLKY